MQKTNEQKGKNTQNVPIQYSEKNTEIKDKLEQSEKKSESTLQLLKRSIFYSKKNEQNYSNHTQKDSNRKKGFSSVQDDIGYNLMYENGICDIGNGNYSISFSFDDINYQALHKDEQLNMFQKYCELLEYYPAGMAVQVSIVNAHINKDKFRNTMLIKQKKDGFDKLRSERNNILMQQAVNGNNSIINNKYLTISVPAVSYEKAQSEFSRISSDTRQNFKQLGCGASELSGIERCEVLYSHFNPTENFNFEYRNLIYSGLTTKDYICPSSIKYEKNKIEFNESYSSVLYIKEYPNSITDQFIKEISDIECQMSINLHLKSTDKGTALDIVDTQLSMMETRVLEIQRKASKYGDVPLIPRELQYSIEEAEELRDDVNSNGMKMFIATVIISVSAESKEKLLEHIERIKGVGRQHSCEITEVSYLQKEGLNSSLVLGNNQLEHHIKRTLTSASAGMMIPFTTQELFQSNGIYYGLNQISNNIISFNRKTLKNSNGVILGTPGGGKSFFAKREVVDVFLSTDDSIIILDPEREYGALVNTLHGQNIYVNMSSDNYINPFDINENYADKDNPLTLKSDFITSMIQHIAGGRSGLSEMTLSIIDRCVNYTYADYFSKENRKMPTFPDFWESLKNQPEPEAKDLAVALERYVSGNLNLFAHHSNVNLNNRLICFDTRDLGKQLRSLGMLICLDFIWNKITENREKGVRTWLYFDEFYLFFEDEYSGQFFFELWKRARKWGAIPTGITQNVEDLLLSDTARRILSNTEFAVLLNQSSSDRNEISRIFNLSPQQENYITNSNEGEGLIVSGKTTIPFKDKFPKDTALYRVLTTKFDEIEHNKKVV